MSVSEEEIEQLYQDAKYYHLVINGKKVVKNKYGLFWDKRKQ